MCQAHAFHQFPGSFLPNSIKVARLLHLVITVLILMWCCTFAPKQQLHLVDTTIPTLAISYIATFSEVACCTIDQVTTIPMGLLHLGYLPSYSSSFDQPRASQGAMLVETPSPHLKPPLATQDGTHRCASYFQRLAPSSPSTFSEIAVHIPSRVPSWVKSSWHRPTDKAKSSRGPKPCAICSPRLDRCTKWTPLVWCQAGHVALEAPHPNEYGKECHHS